MTSLLLLLGTAWAEPQVRTLEFAADLGHEHDISLQGLHAGRSVSFSIPQAWALTDDPVLHLDYEHSGVLVPSRSNLTVLVNEQAVGTLRLGLDSAIHANADIVLPRDVLQPWNELRFQVTQHLDAECEDPFDSALWTQLSKGSRLELSYEDRDVAPQLLDWPFPIFDERGYGPLTAAFDLPDDPDAASLDALSQLSISLGRVAGYRGTEFVPEPPSVEQATTAILQVGLVQDLVPLAGVVLPPLKPGDGAIALAPNPANPSLPVVVVTGADAAGLASATRALVSRDHHTLLSGAVAVVRDVGPARPDALRDVPLPVPQDQSWFTLADLAIPDQTVRGFYSPSVRVPLRFEGNSQPMEDQAELFLDFAYGAQVDPVRSLLEVRLNGIPMRAWTLDEADGAEQQRVRMVLPAALLEPASVLEFGFRLVPRGRGGCVQIRDRQLWATVFDTTELRVPRDRYAWLPDLGLLQFDFWPYARDLDEGVLLVLPDAPDRYSLSAAANLAAHVARMGAEDPPWLRVVSAAGLDLSEREERHAVLISDGSSHSVRQGLIADHSLADLTGWKALPDGWRGSVQQIRHPWQDGGTVLEVAAPNGPELAVFGSEIRTHGRQQHLEETAAVFGPDWAPVHVTARERKRVGALHVITLFRLAAEKAYPIVGFGVFLAGVVLARGLRRWAAVRGGAM